MARIWRSDGADRRPLDTGWVFASVAPDSVTRPSDLQALSLAWRPAQVPGTVASAWRQAKLAGMDGHDFDGEDVWFCRDTVLPEGDSVAIGFAGLATIADVYWDDRLILQSSSMFLAHQVDTAGLPRQGRLSIHIKSLNHQLAARRPRPRWRTKLVERQQLRWLRTTLLGRIPGWSAKAACVGPYRPIEIIASTKLALTSADVRATVEGDDGVVRAKLGLRPLGGSVVTSASLVVGEQSFPLSLGSGSGGELYLEGEARLLKPKLWWPHTHGGQPLYRAFVLIQADGDELRFDLAPLGFRTVAVDQSEGGFSLLVNGQPIFCRGACWVPPDVVALSGGEEDLRPTLLAARAAGMNMIRVGGTMIYESDAFYRLCDELGVMVWQDFMFANMDYPVQDPAFAQLVEAEAVQFLHRVQTSACLVVLCGNSEVEQQAAMLGLPKELWSNAFFAASLPRICAEVRPDVPYWPSTPSGGVLPFQVDAGVSHYYGVGAYLRPLDDARRAGVRFTAECLGFSHVPDDATIHTFMQDGQAPVHHPRWKEGVPRDGGAGWDFEDVRDHYLRTLFRVDPLALRYADMERYLQLARVTSGEVIAAAMAEWRRAGSQCRGALVWFLRDQWPGAGWGLIDATGRPKAAYYYTKRVMAALTVVIVDDGLNGLVLHAINDGPEAFEGRVELALFRHGEVRVATGQTAVVVPPRSVIAVRADALFEHFLDTAYAYRFGPAGHDVAVATMQPAGSPAQAIQAFHFPLGLSDQRQSDLGLTASCHVDAAGSWWLTVGTRLLAQSVAIDLKDFAPDDNFFHVAPGGERRVRLVATGKAARPMGSVWPLNARQETKVLISTSASQLPEGLA